MMNNIIGLICLLSAWMGIFGFVAVAVGPSWHRRLFTVLFYICAALLLGVVALDYFDIIGEPHSYAQPQLQPSQPQSTEGVYKAAGPMIWFVVMSFLTLIWGVFINRPRPRQATLEYWQSRREKNNIALLAILIIGAALLYLLI